jgi:hypothetical protein
MVWPSSKTACLKRIFQVRNNMILFSCDAKTKVNVAESASWCQVCTVRAPSRAKAWTANTRTKKKLLYWPSTYIHCASVNLHHPIFQLSKTFPRLLSDNPIISTKMLLKLWDSILRYLYLFNIQEHECYISWSPKLTVYWRIFQWCWTLAW